MQTKVRICSYTSFSPPPEIADVVKRIWRVRISGRDSEPVSLKILADECPGVVLQCSGSDAISPLPRQFLYGTTTRPGVLPAADNVVLTGVILHPWGVKRLFGLDADEITNRMIDLELVDHKFSRLLERAALPDSGSEILFDGLKDFCKKADPADELIEYLIKRIHQHEGKLAIRELSRISGYSERHITRRFSSVTGISPKLYSRLLRFRLALHRIRNLNFDKLSDVAYEQGFADQAHFIREFKAFSGYQPGMLLKPEVEETILCRD